MPGQRLSPLEVTPYALWVCLTGRSDAISSIVVTWVSQLSFSPPLIGVALESDSEFLKQVVSNGQFTLVMLPRDGGKDIAKRVLKAGGAPHDPRADNALMARPPWEGVPHGSLGAIRLTVNSTVIVGDHTLIVGMVGEQERWVEGGPLRLSDTGWKYTKPGTDAPPPSPQQ
jgi:flavin reductase (DIM6/NTAB) family NADH-FMN oxidoreductase RutF